MRPSSDRGQSAFVEWLDWAAFFGIVASLVAYVIPFWPEGRLRVAFWLIVASTLLHVLASRRRKPIERGGPDA